MDASIISTSLTAAKGTVDLIRASIEISKSLDKIELTQKLLEAQMGTIELMGRLTESIQENNDLKESNKILSNRLKEEKQVESHFHLYWKREENGSLDGPFDPEEYDRKKIYLRMRALQQTNFVGSNDVQIVYDNKADRRNCYYVPLKFLEENKFNPDNIPKKE